jgi:hypothetical protein
MTDQTKQKPLIGWIDDGKPDWGNKIMGRVDDREPFATQAGYCRLLSFLQCVENDIIAFENLKDARKLLPPLMSEKFFRLIRADIKKFNVSATPDYRPLSDIQGCQTYSVVGWLLVIQRMLFNIKFIYNGHYWTKLGEFGHDTWCKNPAKDFDVAMNRALDIYYSGELTREQEAQLDVGRAAAVERLNHLSATML